MWRRTMEIMSAERAKRYLELLEEIQPFTPRALYEARLDRIVVTVRQSNYVEDSPDPRAQLILFRDRDGGGPAGFAIRCARQFCLDHKLIRNGTVLLCEALDLIALEFPGASDARDLAQDLIYQHNLIRIPMEA
jgi:hypothetical protein